MKLPDTNIWLALALSKHLFHSAAQDWLAAQSTPASVLFCRSTQQSLLRLLTTERLMEQYETRAMTNAAAWDLYEKFLADSRIAWVPEPHSLDAHWESFAARKTCSPKMWMDAYLAAFAVAGNHQFITTDHGFAQYKGLNPLILSNAAPA